MKIERELFIKLLSAPEYASYLLHHGNGKVSIDMEKIPKDCYKPLSGDYVAGFKLVNRINDAKCENEMLPVTCD